MRITDISAVNYLSLRALNINIADNTRVLLVAGDNGVGKTGVVQAVKLAITSEPIRGLTYKNELSELVTLGEKDGRVIVNAISDGAPGEWSVNLKNGSSTGGKADGALAPLDPRAFLSLPSIERKKALFTATNNVPTPATVSALLIERGHDKDRVNRLTSHFRAGFDAAIKEAERGATEARGAWKALTNETYGEKKAADWKAPLPAREKTDPLETLRDDLAKLQERLTGAELAVTEARSKAAAWAVVERATAAHADLGNNEKQLAAATERRAELAVQVEDLAKLAAHSGDTAQACPACGVMLAFGADRQLREHKPSKDHDPVKAFEQLKAARQSIASLDVEIQAAQARVAEGRAAKAIVDAMPLKPDPEAPRRAAAALETIKSNITFAQNDIAAAERAATAEADAAALTARARAQHEDVLGYVSLADAIQHLPAEYMQSTLTTVNQLCAEAAASFGTPVTIGEDMEPRYGVVRYGNASESQQWRVEMAVGYALAVLGGLRVLVLDRFDLVQPKRRGAILQFLGAQDKVQVILAATLKERPLTLPSGFQLAWLS